MLDLRHCWLCYEAERHWGRMVILGPLGALVSLFGAANYGGRRIAFFPPHVQMCYRRTMVKVRGWLKKRAQRPSLDARSLSYTRKQLDFAVQIWSRQILVAAESRAGRCPTEQQTGRNRLAEDAGKSKNRAVPKGTVRGRQARENSAQADNTGFVPQWQPEQMLQADGWASTRWIGRQWMM